MPIKVEDVKLMASQRLSDTTDGGGQMTGFEVVDGNVNNLFPDISRLDRVYGRVSLRKAFVSIGTDDSDTYNGAHVILSVPALDPNVNICLFTTNSPHDKRANASDRLESYVTRGPRYMGWLWGPQLQGSRSLLLFQPKGASLPSVGEVLFLIKDEGKSTEKSQYVRITKVESNDQNFTALTTYGSASYARTVVNIQIGDPLRDTYAGSEMSNNDALASNIYTTSVSDAAKYYGVMLPTAEIHKNDISVNVNTIFTHLVPSAQGESPVVDLSIGEAGPVMGSGSPYTVTTPSTTWANGSQLQFSRGIKLGSLTITGGGKTFVDDSTGILMEGATERGTVDYSTGTVTFTSITGFTAVLAATAIIGAKLSRVPNSSCIEVTISNRGYNFTAICNPLPHPKTLTVDYMAQGKWYRVRDNGKGGLIPDIAATGTGTVNYSTGSVVLTCAALPDADTLIIFTWGAPVESQDISGEITIPVAEISHTIASPPVKPLSLLISWPSGAGTATATDNGSGVITGNATGFINYATGLITFKPTLIPAAGSVYTIDYAKYPRVMGELTGTGGLTYNATIPGAPLKPKTVSITLTTTIRSIGRTHTFTDNGSGVLTAEGWEYDHSASHPEWEGTTVFNPITGTIDYLTGGVQINLAQIAGLESWREPVGRLVATDNS